MIGLYYAKRDQIVNNSLLVIPKSACSRIWEKSAAIAYNYRGRYKQGHHGLKKAGRLRDWPQGAASTEIKLEQPN